MYVVSNNISLTVEGFTELPIRIGSLDVINCFIIVITKVANIFLGNEFLKTNICNIITSVNKLVVTNVAIPIHSRLNIS